MLPRPLAARQLLAPAVVVTVACGLASIGSVSGWAAQGATCHGQAATIVGEPGSDVEGTDGPDVVVSNGARTIDTGLGDDLVCVTRGGDLREVLVHPGAGDDIVDASESGTGEVSAYLDAGDDTFSGGPSDDNVYTGELLEGGSSGEGSDTVTTGRGSDSVVTGGPPGSPDHDSVSLGLGRDYVWVQGLVDPAFPVIGGAGRDRLELWGSALQSALVVDNRAGQATQAGEAVMTWAGMERFRITGWGDWVSPSFVGGAVPEQVWTSVPLTAVDLGSGDDGVRLDLKANLVDGAEYDGGNGEDAFIVSKRARRLHLDLPGHSLVVGRHHETVDAQIEGFERHQFSAHRIAIRGTAGSDHVQVGGCRGFVAGRGGDDVLQMIPQYDPGCGYRGADASLVARGGRGDDRLIGRFYPDILLGGRGRDRADGDDNTDLCRAERTYRCER
jgi:Ca2+-binding RTX toxin-like protein